MENKAKKSLKILFMHGLESGPGGSKDQYLRRNFKLVTTPDMQISMLRLTRRNSVLRNVLRHPLFLAWAMIGITLVTYSICYHRPLFWLLEIICLIAIYLIIHKTVVRQALRASVTRCIKIQSAVIQDFQPDIVIGSSWGAMVALLCLSQKIYCGPLLLIAPPLKLILDKTQDHKTWDILCHFPKEIKQQILIIHGEQDDIVPIEHSKLLAKAMNIELKVIAGGDHRLHTELLSDHYLQQLIHEVAARQL